MASSNYNRGAMDIEDHTETFGGFMTYSKYGAAAIIVSLLFPILVFGVNLAWPLALLISVVLGVIIGMIMKFHGRYYAALIGLGVVLGIAIALGSLLF